ncbi:hypothetical protein NPS01_01720 [Nocardioides psychrotolerans]|uniref:Peptidase inhibitor I9 n=1 Tax=Nocardioides psychrotolerans TaxID=1005945 RepID=A0A1I3BRC6_9ACTN|nr:hypothetical protein NPS01_01720 [Nocardioides psychrotolerans]SFH64469.1 Peptidase inhibitor I9 [Nocardioides psychrotolerans]
MVALVALAGAALGLVAAPATQAVTAGETAEDTSLYLVTLRGPGLSGAALVGGTTGVQGSVRLLAQQGRALAAVGDPAPVYRWTTALNGFAVRLTSAQAATLAEDPTVALVERNSVRPLASLPAGAATGAAARVRGAGTARGGVGVVIGVVDSGLDPEGPLFAHSPRLGQRPRDFTGVCEDGEGPPVCNGKVLGARWYVEGFGADDLRVTTRLSAHDDDGHGTQMASIAAGNAGVDVRVHDQHLGGFSGVAPRARLAVYKACWSAPEPGDDGCATADLVTAVDDATRDGVDVLNLSVGGPARIDTVDLALLGAAEADVVVVAAAGNDGGGAAHPAPWVTTVGGTVGSQRRGEVVLPGAPDVQGAMVASRRVGPARLVLAARAKAPGASVGAARVCTPGSLDAATVDGRIVVCDRGGVGRVDKSEAVALADGVGMILTNTRPGSVDADFHRVPTVHLDRTSGRAVKRWLATRPGARVTLRPAASDRVSRAVTGFSGSGDTASGVLKPDLVAPAVGVLGAVPPRPSGVRWDFVTGTSAAAATTSGAAAVLLSRHDWSAVETRSALVTSTDRLRRAPANRVGSGLLRPRGATRPGLAYLLDPGAYRAWWEGDQRSLNTPSVTLGAGAAVATRTLTNTTGRRLYFSSQARGFEHRVRVMPEALRLGPGESATWTMTVTGRGPRLDDGWVVWRGATGTVTRVTAVISR